MSKNILIFSDGTGQAGGFMPDETRSNVYKLFRATRVGPDTKIKPEEQLAYYDPGLGSRGDTSGPKHGIWRRIYNKLSQGTGLGITRNIIDCYTAIIRMWEPGDRIFLFGFSRGAYTARCVGGVLYHCGVPTKMKDGSPLKRDLKSANAIATEAVKDVYQLGSSIKGDPLKSERMERAFKFRGDYGSGNTANANASPYLIAVWDTVSTLGAGSLGIIIIAVLYAVVAALAALGLRFATTHLPLWHSFDFSFFTFFLTILIGVPAILYLKASFEIKRLASLTRYRMAFYDTHLGPSVAFARHAISIDENRRDFARVPWSEEPQNIALVSSQQAGAPIRFKQIWFAGDHSDIGGSYAENESRLSDITLSWVVEEAASLPEPLILDRSVLNLYPLSSGPQHDERRSSIDALPNWLSSLALKFIPESKLLWVEGLRSVPNDAPLHQSVLERFQAEKVLIYGEGVPYRPTNLRQHNEVKQYY